MNRLDKWLAREWQVALITTGEKNAEQLWSLAEHATEGRNADKSTEDEGLVNQLFKMAKEIVFDVDKDGRVLLTPVTWILDTDSFRYVLKGLIEGQLDTDDEVKMRLVQALINEVPVVPNREAVRAPP